MNRDSLSSMSVSLDPLLSLKHLLLSLPFSVTMNKKSNGNENKNIEKESRKNMNHETNQSDGNNQSILIHSTDRNTLISGTGVNKMGKEGRTENEGTTSGVLEITKLVDPFLDDACLNRYLRANRCNPQKAYEALKRTLLWRKEFRVNEIDASQLMENFRLNTFYLSKGRD